MTTSWDKLNAEGDQVGGVTVPRETVMVLSGWRAAVGGGWCRRLVYIWWCRWWGREKADVRLVVVEVEIWCSG